MDRVVSILMVSVALFLAAGVALIVFLAVSIGCGWLAAITVCEEYEVRGVMAVCGYGGD